MLIFYNLSVKIRLAVGVYLAVLKKKCFVSNNNYTFHAVNS